MQYLLTCECGHKLAVTKSQAGQSVVCECGKQVAVPTLRAMTELPLVSEDVETVHGSRSDRAQSVWRGWRGTVFAMAVAVLAIASVTTAYFAYAANVTYVEYTVEDELAIGSEKLDAASPEELSMALNDFRSVRLTYKDRPMFYRYAKFSKEQARAATISGIVAGVGLLIALGVWVTAPRGKRGD